MYRRKTIPIWQLNFILGSLFLLGISCVGIEIKNSYASQEFVSPVPEGGIVVVDKHYIPIYQETIDQYVAEASKKHRVPRYLLHCVIDHESDYREQAVGDSGKAVGVAQFWIGTWQDFRKKMGKSTEDERDNPKEAIDTLAWAISNGLGSHWTAIKLDYCN